MRKRIFNSFHIHRFISKHYVYKSNEYLINLFVILVKFWIFFSRKGEAEIKSDNVTTIAILKSNLTQEATKKRNKIDINTSKFSELTSDLNFH